MSKVSVIGAGNVGATAVYYIAEKNIADIVMVDVVPGLPQSKALDFLHAAHIGLHRHNAGRAFRRGGGDYICAPRESVLTKIGDTNPKSEMREPNRGSRQCQIKSA